MTARQVFYAPHGVLRAPWRVAGFVAVGLVAVMLVPRAGRQFWPRGRLWDYSFTFTAVLIAAFAAHECMLRMVDKRSWSTVGLGRAQARPRILLTGLALGALGILIPSGVLVLSHRFSFGAPSAVAGTWSSYALTLAVLFLPQALGEELVSRGYIFAAIRESAGPVWAIAITSVVFAAGHYANPGANAQSLSLVLLAGIWLGFIVVATGSLWAAWLTHFAWNWSIVALLHAPVSGVEFPAPTYSLVDGGPTWATGGAWGPEGGAGAALGMLGGIGALAIWRRRTARSAAPELARA